MQAFVNGDYCDLAEAKISVFDRGFLFGDAIYEVLPVYDGKPFSLERHINRLYDNLKKTHINPPQWDLPTIITHLITKNGGGDMQIYLQVTRGNQGVRKHDITPNLSSSLIAFTLHNKYPTSTEQEKGLSAKLVEDIRWTRCDIKTTSLLANILVNDEALSSGYQTAILVRNGVITEGSASTIFIVTKDGTVKTSPLNNFCLPGITREIIIELIKELNWSFVENEFTVNELLNAKEVWITSTTKEIYPVTKIDTHLINGGKMGDYCQIINEHYKKLVNND